MFVGKDALADAVTLNEVDRFRKELVQQGVAVNQVKEVIKVAKVAHNWGESRELVSKNSISKYRFKRAKEDSADVEPGEYTADERDRLLAAFNPRLGTQWRPWAMLMIIGHHGVRASAALHLRWEDLDAANQDVIWRAQYDKVGREWTQALTWELVSALAWARHWRERVAYDGPYVFFSRDVRSSSDGGRQAGVYRIQSFLAALVKAEARAGVKHQPYRGAHGMRRMVAGEVNARTGDPVLAMYYIGDTDLKTMKRYLKRRDDRLRAVAELWTMG